MTNTDLILQIAGMTVIIACVIAAGATLRNVRLETFGDDTNTKRKVAMRLIANIYIFLCIVLILLSGFFKIFNEQVVLLLFVAGLSALGLKITLDIKQ